MNHGKCSAYFAQLKVLSVGGGVREGMGLMDFTALGRKLCFSLFVGVVLYLNLLPERRGTNRWCPGQVGSAAIRTSPCLDPAVVYWVQVWERRPHNPLCSFHHLGQVLLVLHGAASVPQRCAQTEDALCCCSVEACQKLREESSPVFSSFLRSKSLCWAFLTG